MGEIYFTTYNRTTQREKIAISSKEIYASGHERKSFYDTFPEPTLHGLFPDTTPVLVGPVASEEHYEWILQNHKYDVMLGMIEDQSLKFDSPLITAKYILLYKRDSKEVIGLYKVLADSPHICTSEAIAKTAYPDPASNHLYLMFDICSDSVERELSHDWRISHLTEETCEPHVVNYINLFEGDPMG